MPWDGRPYLCTPLRRVAAKPLVSLTSSSAGEIITISYTPQKAADCRDATAKAIYGRLFNFIVSFINGVLASEHHSVQKATRIGKQAHLVMSSNIN